MRFRVYSKKSIEELGLLSPATEREDYETWAKLSLAFSQVLAARIHKDHQMQQGQASGYPANSQVYLFITFFSPTPLPRSSEQYTQLPIFYTHNNPIRQVRLRDQESLRTGTTLWQCNNHACAHYEVESMECSSPHFLVTRRGENVEPGRQLLKYASICHLWQLLQFVPSALTPQGLMLDILP